MIFSPTETEKYLLCPRLRQLGKLWEPREQTWTPNMALGTAIHAGLAQYYGGEPGEALDAARAAMAVEYEDGSEYTLDACLALVETGMAAALKTDLVGDGEVIAVEYAMSHMYVDLIVRNSEGLSVIDHKVTLKMDKGKQLPYRILDYDPSWQLLQYPWGLREYAAFGTPVWAKAHLIILTPRPFTYVHAFPVSDARLDDFEHSAYQHWDEMASHDITYRLDGQLAPMNTRSCHAYGRKCDFYELCHTYCGDETKAPTLYERKAAR